MLGRLAATRALKGLHRQLRPEYGASASLSTKVHQYDKERTKFKQPPFEEVLYGQDVNTRTVTFNRPKVLNALNLPMVRNLTPMIQQFEKNPTVNTIVLEGAGEKAFCAGGDIRFLYDNGKDPETRHLALDFFREEYRLNYILATMKTPVVSIINGITMGGGVGLSLHGKFVVATEKTSLAMPETAIGFFPDVGASYILPRLGRKLADLDKYEPVVSAAQALAGQGLGTFLALTGERIKGAELLALALATHYVDAKDVELLKDQLREFNFPEDMAEDTRDDMVAETITMIESTTDPVDEEFLTTVEAIFGAKNADDSVQGIFDRLTAHESEWATNLLHKLQSVSPLSLNVTLRQMREGANKTIDECFQMEYRLATRFMESQDFFEGVRAVIVDKDNKPKWQHAHVSDVTAAEVDSFFAPLPEGEELILYKAPTMPTYA
ncbi:hypothetical protein H310_01919 [Aphanomyces invadans]|uniref:3-hydroxyisobutyryl-CoA hydrolase n=1 Tax=Aphanomyces invadans TaxID=157072 RepID=A0A024UMA4_9STRA|nr:hypothetical protein H310_01919 [Aphanomyces invadans]ETW07394.1 hypothetical protein H310_01919 [Aphanomyces invadans]|eukprot:XP_008863487.1 hypothetical protein H310_01919 [Aphanomyces invadans]